MEQVTIPNGLQYDAYNGDFCLVRDVGDGVALVHPKTSDEYHRMTYEEWEQESPDFHSVSQEALVDPAAIMQEFMDTEASMDDLPMSELADVIFAKANTKVVETDGRSYTA